MSLTKWKNDEEMFPSFTSFLDEFWGKDLYSGVARGTTIPAVNINEEEDKFQVEVAAPGLKKEDFNVNLENNVLTISAEHKEEKEEKVKKSTLREFNFTSFRRSFTVPDSVKAEDIHAVYKDGVLHLTLPKKEEAKKTEAKTIAIE